MPISFRNERTTVLVEALEVAGFKAKVAGGAVRDSIRGETPKDIDFATDASPEEMVETFSSAGMFVVGVTGQSDVQMHKIPGFAHGTVRTIIGGEEFETTTLRSDVETDGRHATVAFVRDFQTDAARRDFTFNAMFSTLDGEISDYFGGMDDLEMGRVRFVGDARSRIQEDRLRAMRYFRFSARFGKGEGDPDTLDVIRSEAEGMSILSGERIWQEMSKILPHPRGWMQLPVMKECGILDVIGLRMTEGMEHAVREAAAMGASSSSILGLFVDDQPEAEELFVRWRLSRDDLKEMAFVAEHKHLASGKASDFAGLVADGIDIVKVEALIKACGRGDVDLESIRAIPPFPLAGRDLLSAGLRPGPQVGEELARLRAVWKEGGCVATKDELLDGVEAVLLAR